MASLVELVPGGDVNKFFRTNRPIIILDLMKSYGLTREEAEDSFQEGSIALFRQVQEGKLSSENLTARLSSYLNRCCRNHATHILQKSGRKAPELPENGLENFGGATDDDEANLAKKMLIEQLEIVIPNLPEPCNTILWKVCYEHFDDHVVAEMLNRPITSFRVTKSKCIKKLKMRINSLVEEMKS
ncbi:MAG: sigma-70 family RNA polymerase sigma factor [Bacteroidaceae bacterium]|nr:sigma-70 family RNA polymerase sigma factor [Bacteroidaceae bacterium]